MATNGNQKGKRGELEFVHLLEDFGYTARRAQQYQGVPVEGSADIICDELEDCLRFEVKRYKDNAKVYSQKVADWIEQAKDDCPEGKLPVVAFRHNYGEWELFFKVTGMIVRTAATKEHVGQVAKLSRGAFVSASGSLNFIDKNGFKESKDNAFGDGILKAAEELRGFARRLTRYGEGKRDAPSEAARGESD